MRKCWTLNYHTYQTVCIMVDMMSDSGAILIQTRVHRYGAVSNSCYHRETSNDHQVPSVSVVVKDL